MNVTCDPKKDALNMRKHHISLNEAKRLEWDLMTAEEDTRFAYGEIRMVGFAPIGMQVFCVVFTDSGDIRRNCSAP